ncbi:MAG: MoxR family ATPase [Crenarchaeota archaeon]|nr:MoxR family ATPase [Thermoproteota archaeon]
MSSSENKNGYTTDELKDLVILGLNQPGKRISDIKGTTAYVGIREQEKYQELPIWHNKTEIDDFIKEKINVPESKFKSYPSRPDSNFNPFYMDVARIMTQLRQDKEIIDWNIGSGIWRLVNTSYLRQKFPDEITASTDDFESLIRKFDEDRNLFNSEWSSQKNESLKTREDFIIKFPIDGIQEIALDDYVIGKFKIKSDVRPDTFSYMLKKGLDAFGVIPKRWPRYYGIYWKDESHSYVWNGDFKNPEDAFSEIKNEISGMLKAAHILEQDGDRDKFTEYMENQKRILMSNVKSKILCVYFPELFLKSYREESLTNILDKLEFQNHQKNSRYVKEKAILNYKYNHHIMKNWDNLDYGQFLSSAILGKNEDEIEPDEFDDESGEDKSKTFEDTKLSLLTLTEIKTGYEKIKEELLIPEDKITEIVTALASGRHLLLAGPIGTGKTRLAKRIPEIFWDKVGGYYSEDHTATADWSTQDVIGGIYPKMENGKPVYDIQHGCVVDTVRKNWENDVDGGMRIPLKIPQKSPPYKGTWLIIDEFNRADIDKAFGQLFTALRTRWLKIPTDEKGVSYKNLKIPKDYRIIGTLNTADKHFLFQLSDALKSRFAYIEIDIPKKDQWEKEIYYAIKNALAELDLDGFDKLVLDDKNKKVNKEKSDADFYNRVMQAYYFLDTVRVFKKLGTAILKLIYQNLIVGTIMTENSKISLDNALTSNLIPQLENLSVTFVSAIHALHSDILVSFIKDAYKSPHRQSYVEAFEKILDYLQVQNKTNLVSNFANGNIKLENEDVWRPIQTAYDNKKKDFEIGLEQIKQSMDDLIKSMVI